MEENLIRKLFIFYKENKMKVRLVGTIVGIVILMLTINTLFDERNDSEEIITRWVEQLPDEHWLKAEFGDFASLSQTLEINGAAAGELSIISLGKAGKTGKVGKIYADIIKSTDTSTYCLKYADSGKKVKSITLKKGDDAKLELYQDGVVQEFDIEEDEWIEKQELLVISCVEDPAVATIYDGTITANKKGKTTLQLLCDGEIYEYKIKVK